MNPRIKKSLSGTKMRFCLPRLVVLALLAFCFAGWLIADVDEAHAMVETWRDSWFEEGSRLIYVVPRGFIDKVLPLTISPAPGQITRVFLGRLEIVTPATARAVETAVASNDEVTLNQYERFLEPILRTVREEHSASTR